MWRYICVDACRGQIGVCYISEVIRRLYVLKVGITGTSHRWNYKKFKKLIDESYYKIDTIVTGNASGIDRLARQYAQERNIPLEIIDGMSEFYNNVCVGDMKDRHMAKIRDREFVDTCDAFIIVWDNDTYGTKHVIDIINNSEKRCSLFIIKK